MWWNISPTSPIHVPVQLSSYVDSLVSLFNLFLTCSINMSCIEFTSKYLLAILNRWIIFTDQWNLLHVRAIYREKEAFIYSWLGYCEAFLLWAWHPPCYSNVHNRNILELLAFKDINRCHEINALNRIIPLQSSIQLLSHAPWLNILIFIW